MYIIDKFYIGGDWVVLVGIGMMLIMNFVLNVQIGMLILGVEGDVDYVVVVVKVVFDGFFMMLKVECLVLLDRFLFEICKW